MTHVLDGAGVRPSTLRQTRLAEFAHQLDPRLVAAAFGMTEEGALHYLIGGGEQRGLRLPPAPVNFRHGLAHLRANPCAFSNGQWLAIPSTRRS